LKRNALNIKKMVLLGETAIQYKSKGECERIVSASLFNST